MSHEVNYENVASKLATQLASTQLNLAAVTDLAEQLQQENQQLKSQVSTDTSPQQGDSND